ncbi:protein translocase subunit SecF [Marinicella gelatinilytica]|uniref:protein translocase subunit SecF n=1 Tax=Marinicella gelatinilytica TaxID=2996017 RepID=UPI002260FCE8|nr:protein translocase subunit SecF [Marinicella gelatinilytica]MCX7544691.1 protein translocase subunit SecF [Marinicella gelatinilytica]
MNIFGDTNYDITGKKKIAMVFSSIMIVIAIVAIVIKGFNFGLDFTGGTVIVVHYEEAVELEDVRTQLSDAGYADAVVKNFGSSRDIEITLPPIEETTDMAVEVTENDNPQTGTDEAKLSNIILEVLQQHDASARISKADFVGSQVGDELVEKGSLALLYAIFGILVYVTIRFEWRFSLGAIVALVHDVIITAGVFAIWQVEFDLTVLAALLAVIGYSLNDTIVVFDRIRENFLSGRKAETEAIINTSINQTLSRTVVTSFTTMLVLFALYIFGGDLINSFAFALIIGVVIGTYSSIFVASTATLALGVSREDLIPVAKEGGNLDHIP